MSGITITNNTSVEILVSVSARSVDTGKGGSEAWFPLAADGGTDTWNYRSSLQVIQFIRSQTPGTLVETILGVPGKTTNIY